MKKKVSKLKNNDKLTGNDCLTVRSPLRSPESSADPSGWPYCSYLKLYLLTPPLYFGNRWTIFDGCLFIARQSFGSGSFCPDPECLFFLSPNPDRNKIRIRFRILKNAENCKDR